MRVTSTVRTVFAAAAVAMLAACGGEPSGGEQSSGYITGVVTRPDGSEITTPAQYKIFVNGVSGPGERVGFTPIVKPDGSYVQKLPEGIYHMPYGRITVKFENQQYTLNLEPVDPTGDRESADGIVQNFVWKLTGAKPDINADVNNHTHWYGLSLRSDFSTWRNDINAAPPVPPAGSKVIYTLKPLSTLIDGSEAETLTIEREWRANEITPIDALNDLPPANYEITGVLQLPDGSSKPLLLQGKGDYPNFKPSARIIIEPDETMSHYFTAPIGWVTE